MNKAAVAAAAVVGGGAVAAIQWSKTQKAKAGKEQA